MNEFTQVKVNDFYVKEYALALQRLIDNPNRLFEKDDLQSFKGNFDFAYKCFIYMEQNKIDIQIVNNGKNKANWS